MVVWESASAVSTAHTLVAPQNRFDAGLLRRIEEVHRPIDIPKPHKISILANGPKTAATSKKAEMWPKLHRRHSLQWLSSKNKFSSGGGASWSINTGQTFPTDLMRTALTTQSALCVVWQLLRQGLKLNFLSMSITTNAVRVYQLREFQCALSQRVS
jgi:hypothetical protein